MIFVSTIFINQISFSTCQSIPNCEKDSETYLINFGQINEKIPHFIEDIEFDGNRIDYFIVG